jgi:hypothetical protein
MCCKDQAILEKWETLAVLFDLAKYYEKMGINSEVQRTLGTIENMIAPDIKAHTPVVPGPRPC